MPQASGLDFAQLYVSGPDLRGRTTDGAAVGPTSVVSVCQLLR